MEVFARHQRVITMLRLHGTCCCHLNDLALIAPDKIKESFNLLLCCTAPFHGRPKATMVPIDTIPKRVVQQLYRIGRRLFSLAQIRLWNELLKALAMALALELLVTMITVVAVRRSRYRIRVRDGVIVVT